MFDGEWQAVSGKLGSKTITLPDTVMIITGDRYVVVSPQGRDEGTLTWREGADPVEVDLTGTAGNHAGQTIRAIIRAKGDQLQLSYAVDGTGPPRSWKAVPGTAVITVRYRRVTPG